VANGHLQIGQLPLMMLVLFADRQIVIQLPLCKTDSSSETLKMAKVDHGHGII
jgi:hypothetical protein